MKKATGTGRIGGGGSLLVRSQAQAPSQTITDTMLIPKYCKYIVGSTVGTTLLQTWQDTQTAVLQSRDVHNVTPIWKGCRHIRRAH